MKRLSLLIPMVALVLVLFAVGGGSTKPIGDFASGVMHGRQYSEEALVKFNEAAVFS